MRIGIVPSLNPFGGGLYQYSLAMMEALHILQEKVAIQDEFIVFHREENETALSQITIAGWEMVSLKLPLTPRKRALHSFGQILETVGAGQMAAKSYRRVTSKKRFSDPDSIILRQIFGGNLMSIGLTGCSTRHQVLSPLKQAFLM